MTTLALERSQPPTPTAAETSPPAPWALAGLSLATLLAALGTSSANVSLPALSRAFGATFGEVQWVVLAYLLSVTALIVGVGRLADIVGHRRSLLAGIVVFTAASVACGLAPSLWPLVAARAIQGIGAAAMMAVTLGLVGAVVPTDRRGRAMGLLGTMSAVGTALGPSLGGMLIAAFDWQAVFLINVPLGSMAFLLVLQHVPSGERSAPAEASRFDLPGTGLLALTLAAYALAVTLGRGNFGWLNLTLLALAGGLGALFLFAESKAPSPLVQLTLLRDRGLRTGLVTSGLVATVIMTTLVVGPFYLSLVLGLGAAAVGLVLSLGPLVAAFTGVPAGRLVDRLGARRVTLAGLTGVAGAAVALALLPTRFGLAGYVVPLVLLTASYALFQTANNTAVLHGVAAGRRGVVSGLLNLSRNLGLVTGASVMGALFALGAGTTDLAAAPAPAVAAGLRITFATAAALVGLALVLALRESTQSSPVPVN